MAESEEAECELDDLDIEVTHIRMKDGRCVLSLNGQGYLPCAEHPQIAPGSLEDPNRCFHEALLDARINEVGTGYLESMRYACDVCGAGLHVLFHKIAEFEEGTVRELFEYVGVGLVSGYKPVCVTPYEHAPHNGCPGFTEPEGWK